MELQVIQNKIYEIRGRRVMLDFDLAALYQVETKNLNKAVKRNIERFPERFMFQLDKTEYDNLRFQFGTSSEHGGTRYMPYAFTEQGVSMLSAVLHSPVAIGVSITIMDAFVAMRNYLTSASVVTAELVRVWEKLERLERKDELLARNNEDILGAVNDLSEDIRKEISILYAALGELASKPAREEKPRRRIGYRLAGED